MSTVAGVKPVRFLIGGQWIQDTPSHITHVNPATGEVNYRVCAGTERAHRCSREDGARGSQQGTVARHVAAERAEILHKIADLMMALIPCQILDGTRTNDRHGKSGAAMVEDQTSPLSM